MAQQSTATHATNNERGLVPYTAATTPTWSSGAGVGMLMPLADAAAANVAISAYEELKTAIMRKDDIQVIQGRNFLKKSFWRRIAACFGLSLELVAEERLLLDGKLAYRATYRAIAPNGRTMDGDGMCMQGEKGQMIEHNIRAIAHTRAKNRAISDIVGGGEVSAEEMAEEEEPQQRSPQQPQPAPKPVAWNAMSDVDTLQALNLLQVRGVDAVHAYLREMRAAMKARGAAWTPVTVAAELALRKRARDEQDAVWEVTPAGDNDLTTLETGMPGN